MLKKKTECLSLVLNSDVLKRQLTIDLLSLLLKRSAIAEHFSKSDVNAVFSSSSKAIV